jgi:hypothetical protein
MNNEMFDSQSDVTVVLTSCNRLDLLKETLESFFFCNTYPINEFILIEDSGKITSQEIKECIPRPFQELVSIIINKTPLGQLKSIDRAYENIKTKYVFHCEDDWFFYRGDFIEDSKKVLEHDKHILSVWLRDYHHDLQPRLNGTMSLKDRQRVGEINYDRVHFDRGGNACFSLNPGLRHYEHYPEQGYGALAGNKFAHVETIMSNFFDSKGFYSVLLERSAVKHIGWDDPVADPIFLRKVYFRRLVLASAIFAIGLIAGAVLF